METHNHGIDATSMGFTQINTNAIYGICLTHLVECVGFFICHFCKIQKLFLAHVETIC